MTALAKLKSREVLDSRGRPTVEVEAIASDGAIGRAIVPSGASTGRHEAKELRDVEARRFGGMGVARAVANVIEIISPAVEGFDLDDQAALDATLLQLDGTPDKSRLGANALLAVSLAIPHAAASSRKEELYVHLHRLWSRRLSETSFEANESTIPLPMVNMISGGLHAGRNIDIQDILIIPLHATDYPTALENLAAVHRALGAILSERGEESALVGDEGGFGPKLKSNEQAIERVVEAIIACGMEPKVDMAIALDVAASHFFDPTTKTYRLNSAGTESSASEMVDRLESWVDTYPIVSIEDGLAEDDWNGWRMLTERLGKRVQLIGDDLFATQAARIRLGVERTAGNAALIKVNQVGTLSETFDALVECRRAGFRTIVSARSGETEDTTIADLAVATAAGQIKIGSIVRSERLAKYNRLLRIAEDVPRYAGRSSIGI